MFDQDKKEMSMEQFIRESWHGAPDPEREGPAPDPEGPASPLATYEAKMDSEQLHSLEADTRKALSEYKSPAAVLSVVIHSMFGESSLEAETVARLIRDSEQPGGYELALAVIAKKKRLLQNQAQTLEKELGEVNEKIAALNDAAAVLRKRWSADSDQSAGLLETMEFCKNIEFNEQLLENVKSLYEKYRDNAAAMGLLLGSLVTAVRDQYAQEEYDLIFDDELQKLVKQLEEAAAGNHIWREPDWSKHDWRTHK